MRRTDKKSRAEVVAISYHDLVNMKNNYGLPRAALDTIRTRDKVCVYCSKKMLEHTNNNPRSDWYTIEHLNYLPPWNNPETVVMCCWQCNSSRGNKKIRVWFDTKYCTERNINLRTVFPVVKDYVLNVEDRTNHHSLKYHN